VLAPYAPPPAPGAASPLLWGTDAHVRSLLAGRVGALDTAQEALVVSHFPSAAALVEEYRANFPPLIAVYLGLAGDGARTAALDRDLAAFAERSNRGAPGGPAVFELEYLLAVARR
jgi:hypothetical protein